LRITDFLPLLLSAVLLSLFLCLLIIDYTPKLWNVQKQMSFDITQRLSAPTTVSELFVHHITVSTSSMYGSMERNKELKNYFTHHGTDFLHKIKLQ
jgi:hypothetical protein